MMHQRLPNAIPAPDTRDHATQQRRQQPLSYADIVDSPTHQLRQNAIPVPGRRDRVAQQLHQQPVSLAVRRLAVEVSLASSPADTADAAEYISLTPTPKLLLPSNMEDLYDVTHWPCGHVCTGECGHVCTGECGDECVAIAACFKEFVDGGIDELMPSKSPEELESEKCILEQLKDVQNELKATQNQLEGAKRNICQLEKKIKQQENELEDAKYDRSGSSPSTSNSGSDGNLIEVQQELETGNQNTRCYSYGDKRPYTNRTQLNDEQALKDANQKIEQLQQRLEAAHQQLEQQVQQQQQLKAEQKQLKDEQKQRQADKFQQTCIAFNNAQELKDANQEIEQLQQQLKDANQESANQKLEAVQQLEAVHKQLTDAHQQKLEDVQLELEDLQLDSQQKLQNLQLHLQQLVRDGLTAQSQRFLVLQNENHRLEQQVQQQQQLQAAQLDFQQKLKDAQQQVQQLEKQLEDKEAKAAQTAKIADRKIQNLQQEIRDLIREHQEELDTAQQFKPKLKAAQKQLEDVRQEFEQKLKDEQQQVQQLEKQLDDQVTIAEEKTKNAWESRRIAICDTILKYTNMLKVHLERSGNDRHILKEKIEQLQQKIEQLQQQLGQQADGHQDRRKGKRERPPSDVQQRHRSPQKRPVGYEDKGDDEDDENQNDQVLDDNQNDQVLDDNQNDQVLDDAVPPGYREIRKNTMNESDLLLAQKGWRKFGKKRLVGGIVDMIWCCPAGCPSEHGHGKLGFFRSRISATHHSKNCQAGPKPSKATQLDVEGDNHTDQPKLWNIISKEDLPGSKFSGELISLIANGWQIWIKFRDNPDNRYDLKFVCPTENCTADSVRHGIRTAEQANSHQCSTQAGQKRKRTKTDLNEDESPAALQADERELLHIFSPEVTLFE